MDRKWGRLKDVKVDPLESVGLPSKGDNRHEISHLQLSAESPS